MPYNRDELDAFSERFASEEQEQIDRRYGSYSYPRGRFRSRRAGRESMLSSFMYVCGVILVALLSVVTFLFIPAGEQTIGFQIGVAVLSGLIALNGYRMFRSLRVVSYLIFAFALFSLIITVIIM